MQYTDLEVGSGGESNRPKTKPQRLVEHRRAGSNASTIPVCAGEIVSLPARSDSVPEFIDAWTETQSGFDANHHHFHSKNRWSKMLSGRKKQGQVLADDDYGGYEDGQGGSWNAPGQAQQAAWQSAGGPQEYDTWGGGSSARGGDNKLTKQMSKSKAKIESALSSFSMPAISKGLPKMGKGGQKGRQELGDLEEYGYDRDDTYNTNNPIHSASGNLPSHDPSLAWGASGARSGGVVGSQQAATVGSHWASVDGGRGGDVSGGVAAAGNVEQIRGATTTSQPWSQAGSETSDAWARYEGRSNFKTPPISQNYPTPAISQNYPTPPISFGSSSTPPVTSTTPKWDPFEQHGQAQQARPNLSPAPTSNADPFIALSTKNNQSPSTIGSSPDQRRAWEQSAQSNYGGANLFEPPPQPKQKVSPKSVVADATSAVSSRIGAVGIGKKKDMSLLEDDIDATETEEWSVSGAVSFDQPPPKQRAFVPTPAPTQPPTSSPHANVTPRGGSNVSSTYSPNIQSEASPSAWGASPSLVDQYTSGTGGSNVSPAAGYERDIWSAVGTQEKERNKGMSGSVVLAKLKRSTSKGGLEEVPQSSGWGGSENATGGNTHEEYGAWGERGHSSAAKENTGVGSAVGKTISGALGKFKRQTSKPTVDPVHLPDNATYGGETYGGENSGRWGGENRRVSGSGGGYGGAGGNDDDLWQPGSERNLWGGSSQSQQDSKSGGAWGGVAKAGAGVGNAAGSAAAAVGDMASGVISKIRKSNSKPSDLSSDRGSNFADADIIDDGIQRSQSDAKLERRGSWLRRKMGSKTKSDPWGSGSNPNISSGYDQDENAAGRRMSDVPESEIYQPRAQGGEGGKTGAIEKAKALIRKASKSGSKEKADQGNNNIGGGYDNDYDYDNRYSDNNNNNNNNVGSAGLWEPDRKQEKKKWTVESDEEEYIEDDTPSRPPPPSNQSNQSFGSSITAQPIRTPDRPPPPAIPSDVAPVRPIAPPRPGKSTVPSRPPPPSIPSGESDFDSRIPTRPAPPSVPSRPAPPAVTPRRPPPPQY